MQGIEERLTRDGIRVVRLHFTANESKRSEDWIAQAELGYAGGRHGKQWKREMEIDWTIASGIGIYSDDFNREVHVAKSAIRPIHGLPMQRGFDFGLTPAGVWAQLTPEGGINVLSELVAWDGREALVPRDAVWLAREAHKVSHQRFDTWAQDRESFLRENPEGGAVFDDVCDPAGFQKSQADSTTAVQMLNQKQIYPVAGMIAFTGRKAAMVNVLGRLVGGRPAFQIDPSCTMLIEGFMGAYRYQMTKEDDEETIKSQADKNAWSHPMDALGYIIARYFDYQEQTTERYEGLPDTDYEPEPLRGGAFY